MTHIQRPSAVLALGIFGFDEGGICAAEGLLHKGIRCHRMFEHLLFFFHRKEHL